MGLDEYDSRDRCARAKPWMGGPSKGEGGHKIFIIIRLECCVLCIETVKTFLLKILAGDSAVVTRLAACRSACTTSKREAWQSTRNYRPTSDG